MAIVSYDGQTLAQIRAKTRTSIHGRQLGLADDYLGGVKAIRQVVTHITTAGTVLPNHGMVILNSTLGPLACTLQAPVPGVSVKMVSVNVESTAGWVVTCASGTIQSSAGLDDTKVTFKALGGSMELLGVTTASWLAIPSGSTRAVIT